MDIGGWISLALFCASVVVAVLANRLLASAFREQQRTRRNNAVFERAIALTKAGLHEEAQRVFERAEREDALEDARK